MFLHVSGYLRKIYLTVIIPRLVYPGSIIAVVWSGREREQPPSGHPSTGTRERSREARRSRLVIANTATELYKWWRGRTSVTANRSTRHDTNRVRRAGMKIMLDMMLSVKRPVTYSARASWHEELTDVVLFVSILIIYLVTGSYLVVSG